MESIERLLPDRASRASENANKINIKKVKVPTL
jgi:hypothetical protein